MGKRIKIVVAGIVVILVVASLAVLLLGNGLTGSRNDKDNKDDKDYTDNKGLTSPWCCRNRSTSEV